jgi:hydrogenase nickel incorporation protein HypA/HybF
MHELSVTMNVLEIALRHADGKRITGIHLVVGQLSSMVDDAVQFYWDIISQGTNAEGAQLHFERIPAELECRICGTHYGLQERDFICPTCGGASVRVVKGEEFLLDSIEIEEQVDDHERTRAGENPQRE